MIFPTNIQLTKCKLQSSLDWRCEERRAGETAGAGETAALYSLFPTRKGAAAFNMDGVQAGCLQDFFLAEDISRVEDFHLLSRSPSANFVHLETEPAGLSTYYRMDQPAGSSLLFEDLFPVGFLSDDETMDTAHDSGRTEHRGCASLNAAASSFQPLEQQADQVRDRESCPLLLPSSLLLPLVTPARRSRQKPKGRKRGWQSRERPKNARWQPSMVSMDTSDPCFPCCLNCCSEM